MSKTRKSNTGHDLKKKREHFERALRILIFPILLLLLMDVILIYTFFISSCDHTPF
jgi:hypothetical protein